jgi:hypothetical protein
MVFDPQRPCSKWIFVRDEACDADWGRNCWRRFTTVTQRASGGIGSKSNLGGSRIGQTPRPYVRTTVGECVCFGKSSSQVLTETRTESCIFTSPVDQCYVSDSRSHRRLEFDYQIANLDVSYGNVNSKVAQGSTMGHIYWTCHYLRFAVEAANGTRGADPGLLVRIRVGGEQAYATARARARARA